MAIGNVSAQSFRFLSSSIIILKWLRIRSRLNSHVTAFSANLDRSSPFPGYCNRHWPVAADDISTQRPERDLMPPGKVRPMLGNQEKCCDDQKDDQGNVSEEYSALSRHRCLCGGESLLSLRSSSRINSKASTTGRHPMRRTFMSSGGSLRAALTAHTAFKISLGCNVMAPPLSCHRCPTLARVPW